MTGASDDGQARVVVTEADRKAALDTWLANDQLEAIALALAVEREKAHRDGYTDGYRDGVATGMGDV